MLKHKVTCILIYVLPMAMLVPLEGALAPQAQRLRMFIRTISRSLMHAARLWLGVAADKYTVFSLDWDRCIFVVALTAARAVD